MRSNGGRQTHSEVSSNVPHLFHEVSSQLLDTGQVVLHGEGQVHQVVQVYGVVLHTFELHLKALGFTYKLEMWSLFFGNIIPQL